MNKSRFHAVLLLTGIALVASGSYLYPLQPLTNPLTLAGSLLILDSYLSERREG